MSVKNADGRTLTNRPRLRMVQAMPFAIALHMFVVSCDAHLCGAQAVSPPSISPDLKIQDIIRRWTSAFDDETREKEGGEALKELGLLLVQAFFSKPEPTEAAASSEVVGQPQIAEVK